ncbi:hypothetical protein [Paenibacillus solani]|nr:hypothetical protein [Paenibacillus solani]
MLFVKRYSRSAKRASIYAGVWGDGEKLMKADIFIGFFAGGSAAWERWI